MKKDIGSLGVKLTADIKEYERNLDKARKDTQTFATKIKNSGKSAAKGIAVVGTAAAAMAAGIAKATIDVVQDLDKIGKSADRLGVTTDALQELQYAADKAGVSASSFEMAFQRMGRRAGDAASGNETLKRAFDDLGVSVVDAEGKMRSADHIFTDVIEGLSKYESETLRNAAAMKIFDSEGVKLVNMSKDGAAGLNELREEAKKLGVVFSESLVRDAEKANDELSRMKQIVSAQWTNTWAQFAPTIIEAGEAAADAAPKFNLAWEEIRNLLTGGNLSTVAAKQKVKQLKEEIAKLQEKLDTDDIGFFESRKDVSDEQLKKKRQLFALEKEIAKSEREAETQRKENEEQRLARLEEERKKREENIKQQEQAKRLAKEEAEAEAQFTAAVNASEEAVRKENEQYHEWVKTQENAAEAVRDTLDATREYHRELEALDVLMEGGFLTPEEWKKRSDEIKEAIAAVEQASKPLPGAIEDNVDSMKMLEEATDSFKHTFSSAMADAIIDGESLSATLGNLGDMFRKLLLQKAILMGVDAILPDFSTGEGGSAPQRATGGRVSPLGVYQVNEQGQEFFQPDVAGRIISHKDAPMGGGSRTVQVQINNNGTPQEVTQGSATQTPEGMIISLITSDIQRGGRVSNTIQRTFGLSRG